MGESKQRVDTLSQALRLCYSIVTSFMTTQTMCPWNKGFSSENLRKVAEGKNKDTTEWDLTRPRAEGWLACTGARGPSDGDTSSFLPPQRPEGTVEQMG